MTPSESRPSEDRDGYGYSAQFDVRVYFRAINNEDAFAARERLRGAIDHALVGLMDVDGAKVEAEGVFAEWTQR